MRNKSITFIIFLVLLSCVLGGCSKKSVKEEQEELIQSYLESLKEGNTKKAMSNLIFTEAEKNAGVVELYEDAFEGYDYKTYKIENINKLNDSIYLANVTVNTNFDSVDKSSYVDVEFNPYIVYQDNRFWLVLLKERVPENLYTDIGELPDNYEDMNYLTIEEGDQIYK